MEKEKFLLSKKITLIVLILLSFTYSSTFAQCDPPTNVDVLVGKCAIDDDKPTIGDLSATGQNLAWYDAQTGGNLLPLSQPLVDGQTYWVQQTVGDCTSDRLPTTVTLYDPPTPTTDPTQSFCYPPIATVGNLKSSGTSVLWYETETSLTPLNTSTPLIDGEDYWVAEVSFPCVSTVRAQTTVVLDAAPYAGESSELLECEANLGVTNLFEMLGGTPDTTGVWTGPSELTNGYLGTFEPGINTVGTYTYSVSSILGVCPDASANVTVTITVIPPPTITETTQSFCIDDFLPNAPTVGDLGGSDIQWYGSDSDTVPIDPTVDLINGNEYWAAQLDATSGCLSATRIKVTVALDTAPNAGTNGTYTECEANLVTTNLFSSLGGSPDTTGIWTGPSDLTGGYLGTFEPGTNIEGTYTYTVSSLGICPDDSANVTVTITVIPPPTTTETTQSFCIDEFLPNAPTVADLNPSGGDILWYGSDIDTESIDPSVDLVNGNEYWAAQLDATSGCESATRIKVTVALDTAPNAGTDGSYSDCEIDLADTDLFTLLGGSPDATGTWTAPDGSAHSGTFVAGTDVAGVYTYSVGGPICTPDTATVTVNITVVPAPSITANNPSFCIADSKNVGDLIVDDATSTITWYDAATGGNEVLTTTVLTTTSLWASQTDTAGCESVNRTVVNVTIIDLQTPTTAPSQSFCLVDEPTVANLVATGTNVLWFENETDDVSLALDPALLLVDNKIYWAADVDSTVGCESPGRVSMVVTLNDVAPVTIANVSQTFCESDFPTVENLEASGTSIVWYASETETTPLDITSPLINGAAYWAVQSNTTTGCESSVRVFANVTLTVIATPTLISLGNEFCIIDKPTIADLDLNVSANNGGTISWYDSYPDGNLLNASTALFEGETYYAIETDINGCKSINPLEVTVSLEACDAYDVVIYDGFSPTGNGVNDTFKITNLRELYPNFKVEFFNRWGNLIYTANASKSDWNGRLNGDGELSAAGVYYFVIYFNKNDRKPIQRRLYLSR